MLNIGNLKIKFYNNVFNKFLATSYFVNKKYSNNLINEFALQLELSNSFTNDFTNDTEVELVDISNIKYITINNSYITNISTASYVFTQLTLSTTWTVIHNLGYFPSAPLITDLLAVNLDGIVTNVDINTSIITFSQPQKGYAYFS